LEKPITFADIAGSCSIVSTMLLMNAVLLLMSRMILSATAGMVGSLGIFCVKILRDSFIETVPPFFTAFQ
jgi:hypothetical protein